jgi:GNAT superfamily N-acetyltransferase
VIASAPYERRRDAFVVSTDPARVDLDVVHAFLAGSYWAEGIPRQVVARSIAGSLCFGLYEERAGQPPAQRGFARVITDRATYGYLADVFVVDSHRGRGLGHWLMDCVMGHPELQGLRRWSLVTRDAHELYRPFGFTALAAAERHMERVVADIYRSK